MMYLVLFFTALAAMFAGGLFLRALQWCTEAGVRRWICRRLK